jgi:hypothetical protein
LGQPYRFFCFLFSFTSAYIHGNSHGDERRLPG